MLAAKTDGGVEGRSTRKAALAGDESGLDLPWATYKGRPRLCLVAKPAGNDAGTERDHASRAKGGDARE